jgi:hypothetical protein
VLYGRREPIALCRERNYETNGGSRFSRRVATLDVPMPYKKNFEQAALPSAADVVKAAERLMAQGYSLHTTSVRNVSCSSSD